MRDIKVVRTINNIRNVYVDVSALCNPQILAYIEKTGARFCISELTILELKNLEIINKNLDKRKINRVLKNMKVLRVNNTILNMAKIYLEKGIINKENYNDAIHISLAKYYRCYTILYDKDNIVDNKINFLKIACK